MLLVRVLVLSVQDEPQDLRESLPLGASGYALKQAVECGMSPPFATVLVYPSTRLIAGRT
jgi:hypothetical protein